MRRRFTAHCQNSVCQEFRSNPVKILRIIQQSWEFSDIFHLQLDWASCFISLRKHKHTPEIEVSWGGIVNNVFNWFLHSFESNLLSMQLNVHKWKPRRHQPPHTQHTHTLSPPFGMFMCLKFKRIKIKINNYFFFCFFLVQKLKESFAKEKLWKYNLYWLNCVARGGGREWYHVHQVHTNTWCSSENNKIGVIKCIYKRIPDIDAFIMNKKKNANG